MSRLEDSSAGEMLIFSVGVKVVKVAGEWEET